MSEATPPAQPKAETKKRGFRRRHLLWLVLLLLFLPLGTCFFLPTSQGDSGKSGQDSIALARHREDSLARLQAEVLARRKADSLALLERLRIDSLYADSLRRLGLGARADSLLKARRQRQDSLVRIRSLQDSLAREQTRAREDSTRRADSLAALSRPRREPPMVVADPAGGVHPAPIDVAVLTLGATPLCAFEDTTRFKECRDLVRIDRDRILWISAVDSFGTRAMPQRLSYHIDPNASRCGKLRALVPQPEGGAVCVDAYEYPNEPRQLPRTSVSWEEASALCARQGKRLCQREELQLACQGPEGWMYPYGQSHRTNLCQDGGTGLARGHDRPGCRSWWGAFHLAGNAWEWTMDKAGKPNGAYGGFYSEGPQASCLEAKRSFFPQNRYSSVGFRCCESAPQ